MFHLIVGMVTLLFTVVLVMYGVCFILQGITDKNNDLKHCAVPLFIIACWMLFLAIWFFTKVGG